MGWSCTVEQAKTMDRIESAMARTGNKYFMESPRGGLYGKDYGTPECKDMYLPVWKRVRGNKYERIGYARIKPDGSFSLPKGIRKELNL